MERIVELIDNRINETLGTDRSIFHTDFNMSFAEGLIDDEDVPVVSVWFSFLSGLNVLVPGDHDIYRVNALHHPTLECPLLHGKTLSSLNKIVYTYCKIKSEELYRWLLANGVYSFKHPGFDEEVELFSVDNGIISQNKFIPYKLEKTLAAAMIPSPKVSRGDVAVITRDESESREDFDDPDVLWGIERYITRDDIPECEQLLASKYDDIVRTIRGDGKMCLPGVWDCGDGIYIDFTPRLCFEIIGIRKNTTWFRAGHLSFTTPDSDIIRDYCDVLKAEVRRKAENYLEGLYESCVDDIIKEFKASGHDMKQDGVVGNVKWVIYEKDENESDDDEERMLMFGRSDSDSDSDFEAETESGSDTETESGSDSSSDSEMSENHAEFVSQVRNAFMSIGINEARIDSMLRDLPSDYECEEGDLSGDDVDEEEAINRLNAYYNSIAEDKPSRYDDIVEIVGDEYILTDVHDIDNKNVNVIMKIRGANWDFYDTGEEMEIGFRTRGYVQLKCVLKQLSTARKQVGRALTFMKVYEDAVAKGDIPGRIVIRGRDEEMVKIKQDVYRFNMNGRILEKNLKTGKTLGVLEDTVFDRVVSKWTPYDEEPCSVCYSPGGIRTSCCNQMTHVGCLLKWAETCIKERRATTCPSCRSLDYIK